MTAEMTSQITTGLLLIVLGLVLVNAFLILALILHYRKRRAPEGCLHGPPGLSRNAPGIRLMAATAFESPCRWLALKTSDTAAVQSALRLQKAAPCFWEEGIAHLSDFQLFISPPIEGWTLVVGQALPDPFEDPDRVFHWLRKLLPRFEQVQFYALNQAVDYHFWLRAERGKIRRAYAWAGETIWNQGHLTHAENDLEMRCFDYGAEGQGIRFTLDENAGSNSEKIWALAARWSLDPTALERSRVSAMPGVAGTVLQSKRL